MVVELPLYENKQVSLDDESDDVMRFILRGKMWIDPIGLKTFHIVEYGKQDEDEYHLEEEPAIGFCFNYSEDHEKSQNILFPATEKDTILKVIDQIIAAKASVVKDFGGA